MGCPRPNSVALGSFQRPRGGGESPGGGGIAGGARQRRQGASAAGYLWISGLGALLLASRLLLVAACIQDADKIARFFCIKVIFTFLYSLKGILMKFVQVEEEKTASLSNLGFEQVRFTI